MNNGRPLGARRDVGATLAFNFLVHSAVALQLSPAGVGDSERSELITVLRDDNGEPVPVDFVGAKHLGRVHIIEAAAGPVTATYSASTAWRAPAPGAPEPSPSWEYDDDVITALRQSRYCPSDVIASFARAEFAEFLGTDEIAAAVA